VLENYRREVLPNGLSVLGVQREDLHSFVCSLYVRVGPRFEPEERTGLSHFLEHMLVQGSQKFPTSNAIMRGVEDLGGIIEAQTYPEMMRLVFGVHRKHWADVMEIAADVVLRPLFDPAEVEQEKAIIAQEIMHNRDREGRNISASELVHELLFKEQVSEAGTRGSPQIMAGFDRGMVEAHYRRFFVPGNMVVCLAGGFDFDEVLGAVAEEFGTMDAGEAPRLAGPEVGERRARSIYRTTEALPVVEALLSHHAYAAGEEAHDAARAVAQLLGGGLSSRLFSRVREELGLVYDITSHAHAFSDAGSLDVYLSVGVENLAAAFRATLEELRRVTEGNFDAAELARYKESVRCGMDILCDQPMHLADWFGRQELLLGPERVVTPPQYVEKQEALTLEVLHETMRHVFVETGANLAVVGPYGEKEKDELRRMMPAEEPC
jgi:predicted Zn-dependent peptidase